MPPSSLPIAVNVCTPAVTGDQVPLKGALPSDANACLSTKKSTFVIEPVGTRPIADTEMEFVRPKYVPSLGLTIVTPAGKTVRFTGADVTELPPPSTATARTALAPSGAFVHEIVYG